MTSSRLFLVAAVGTLSLAATLPLPAADAQPAKTAGGAASAKMQNVSPEEVEKLLKQNKNAVVLDVRSPDEFAEGHIAGAKNVDFLAPDFKQKAAELDKSKTYIVHCAAGGRSAKALKVLEQQNFGGLLHMDAGMNGWKKEGKPVEK